MAFVIGLLLAVFILDSPWNWLVGAGGAAVEVGEAWGFWLYSHRSRPAVGVEALVGTVGQVTDSCRPDGWVRVRGELWRARCPGGADAGDRVRVRLVDGLTVEVEPA
jgi:membrane protein implicated in regulation of membrane protease activity